MTKRRQRPKQRAASSNGKIEVRKDDPRPISDGVLIQNGSLPATEAKNRFGDVLKAARKGPVFIEKHGRREAVVLDIETYRSLLENRRTPDERRLEELREEFDALYARMQTIEARAVVEKFLSLSDEELNDAVARRD